MDEAQNDGQNKIQDLSKKQRRILGVLVEKAFTTPEYYPLTLKALTTGCNQKSNRDPVMNYSEDDVQETVEELKTLGLAATVHTESGRAERVRHYVRKKFEFSEPQLAIIVELLLRGRQQMGELRSRASRMVPIESQDRLRQELSGLMQMKYIDASGPLEKRGIEIDHAFYTSSERKRKSAQEVLPADFDEEISVTAPEFPSSSKTSQSAQDQNNLPLENLRSQFDSLKYENQQLQSEFEEIKTHLQSLTHEVQDLKTQLGV